MGHDEEAKKYSSKMQKVTASQIAYEAMVAGVSPVEMAKKINEAIDQQERCEASGYSMEERQSIYAQAMRAGAFDPDDPKQCEEALKKYRPIISCE